MHNYKFAQATTPRHAEVGTYSYTHACRIMVSSAEYKSEHSPQSRALHETIYLVAIKL